MIGILDPEGNNINPLSNTPYSDDYKKLAKVWSKFPTYLKANEIIDTIKDNQVILITSDTGSGKTVLVPKFALHVLNYNRKIIITLPKKIITKSAAEFAAKTLDVELGNQVGYKYKGEAKLSDNTKLLYATDGTIKSLLLRDILLRDYDCVIIDEAHERKIQIDFLLYLLRETLSKRPEFKLIIMSATIDTSLFVNYFKESKVGELYLSGVKNYDITSFFLLNSIKYNEALNEGFKILMKILKTSREGDIIFFITSKVDTMCDKLTRRDIFCVEVYSGMAPDIQLLAQDKNKYKIDTSFVRKVVFATNVAESSLTIDGIEYVIDTGYEFKSIYDPIYHANRLNKQLISQAQAKQRMGRTGRTSPGVCYHLYTKNDFEHIMSKFPEPEIRTSDITYECLKLLKSIDFKDLQMTLNNFIESPKELYINDAITNLLQLNVIYNNKISSLGKAVLKLDAESINDGIAIIYAKIHNVHEEVCKIISVCNVIKNNINTLFQNKEDRDNIDRNIHSDHLTLLNLYGYRLDAHNIFERLIKKITKINVNELEINKYENISSLDKNDKIIACLAIGYKLNTAVRVNDFYRTHYSKDLKIGIGRSSFVISRPKHVIFNELFISGAANLNIVSEISSKIIDILTK